MNQNKFLIYCLVDPITREIRYIGKSTIGLREPKNYFKPSVLRRRSRRHVINWIKSLINQDIIPEIQVIESGFINEEELNLAEIFYIDFFKKAGCRLTNHTLGGEGSKGYRHTEEAKRAISEAGKKRIFTEEIKRKISESQKGVKKDEAHLEKFQRGRELYFKTNKHPKWHNNKNSDIYKQKLKELSKYASEKSKEKCSIPIINQYGEKFNSLADAARCLALSASEISLNLNGKNKSVKGYTFRRLNAPNSKS